MYEKISSDEFLSLMDSLLGENIWVIIWGNAFSTNIHYEDFQFLEFTNGKYQLGRQEYSEDDYDTLMINKSSVLEIHRDKYIPELNQQQIVLTLNDGNKIIVETEGC